MLGDIRGTAAGTKPVSQSAFAPFDNTPLSNRRASAYNHQPMQMLAKTLFLIVAIVNLAPVSGVLSADNLGILYGVVLEDPNLIILMRHRAVLFGMVGVLLVASAFRPSLRPLGLTAGLISMLSFVVINHLVGDYNAELRRAVLIDLVASALLVGAGFATWRDRARGAAN
jgi:hypothetical protein